MFNFFNDTGTRMPNNPATIHAIEQAINQTNTSAEGWRLQKPSGTNVSPDINYLFIVYGFNHIFPKSTTWTPDYYALVNKVDHLYEESR